MNIKRLDINLSIQYLLDNYIEVHQPHNFYLIYYLEYIIILFL